MHNKDLVKASILGAVYHNQTNQTITDNKGNTDKVQTMILRQNGQKLYNYYFDLEQDLTKEKPKPLIELEKQLLEKYG